MSKRCLQIITALLCVLLLAGCGAKAEDSAGTADDGQQWGPPAQDGFDEPVYRTTIFGSMPYEAPPRRADKVWDGAAWVDPSDPEVTQRTAVEPDVTVTTQWAEGQQGEDGIADAVRDYMTLAYSLRAAPDMTVEEHPCCTDDMVDELRFYAFMMSSDLSFRTRAAETLENLTPSASDNIRVRVLIDAQEATGNITDTAYCQDEHWSTARELALTRLNGRWTVTDDDTDASNFFQGGVADEVPPSRELRQAVEAYFQLRADEMAGQMGDSSCTTNALLADARLFAAQVDWSRVYGAQGRACQFGSSQELPPFDVRLPVTEVMRIDGLQFVDRQPLMRTSFAIVSHMLTLTRAADGRYMVVGDTYEYGGHNCNILDSIN